MLYGVSRFELYTNEADSLNPYFFGKCSTAGMIQIVNESSGDGLNPYFFGKCSTAMCYRSSVGCMMHSLNPYFFGKCSTARRVEELES